jgi:hypothetical protein
LVFSIRQLLREGFICDPSHSIRVSEVDVVMARAPLPMAENRPTIGFLGHSAPETHPTGPLSLLDIIRIVGGLHLRRGYFVDLSAAEEHNVGS